MPPLTRRKSRFSPFSNGNIHSKVYYLALFGRWSKAIWTGAVECPPACANLSRPPKWPKVGQSRQHCWLLKLKFIARKGCFLFTVIRSFWSPALKGRECDNTVIPPIQQLPIKSTRLLLRPVAHWLVKAVQPFHRAVDVALPLLLRGC